MLSYPPARDIAARGDGGNNCSPRALRPIGSGMEHFHVWTRSGRIFTMQSRAFESRTTAHKAAVRLRCEKADRLVLACESCPTSKPSKRRSRRWPAIARRIAAELGAEPAVVRRALDVALRADGGAAD